MVYIEFNLFFGSNKVLLLFLKYVYYYYKFLIRYSVACLWFVKFLAKICNNVYLFLIISLSKFPACCIIRGVYIYLKFLSRTGFFKYRVFGDFIFNFVKYLLGFFCLFKCLFLFSKICKRFVNTAIVLDKLSIKVGIA